MHQRRIETTYKKLHVLIGTTLLLLLIAPMSLVHGQTDSASNLKLRYPLESGYNYPFSNSGIVSPMLLPPPSNIKKDIVYDPATNSYVFSEKIGDLDYRPPSEMNFNEYQNYQAQQSKSDYWNTKAREESGAGPAFMKGLRLGNLSERGIFGNDKIKITPQGSAELIFGYSITKNKNPMISVGNQKNGSFIFKEKIMMNITGSIGDKLEVGLNYNTEATFDFENKTKLEYTGKEDEIIKKIEAGDVSFPLPGTLITGSQSLFGIHTELQFGRLTVGTVFSNQRSESSSINVQGGAQSTEFEVDVDKYDVNRHFFLSHFFRDNYNEWLKNPQNIESQVQIEAIEIWVGNRQNNFEQSRSIVGIMDLAEGYGPDEEPNFRANPNLISPQRGTNNPADNNLNQIYSNISNNELIRDINTIDQAFANASRGGYTFDDGADYIKLENARPLSSREYTLNSQLGYISLNSPLRNEEILAVSYVYTYKGKVYKVGELAADVPEEQGASRVVVTKLLKSKLSTPSLPNWDLMMKNVYAIGAYQVGRENFILNVLYRNDKTGVATNVLNEPKSPIHEQILLTVMELDNLDGRNEPYPDGMFDFVEGVTINSRNGRVIFPVVEPFGKDLRDKIVGEGTDPALDRIADKYVYEELYDSTQTKAQQVAEKNKFFLRGSYEGSGSSDIQLNAMNVPQGSVTVTAGGVPLTEGTDYTVDYTLGRVKILNQGLIESGTPIKVSLESNSFFNVQQKTLMGTHLDYRFSENFNIGGTILRLNERPLTEKVNVGEESISNTIWGLNTSYRQESQFLTTLVDAIPLIETKEVSSFIIDAEFAQLIPGQSKITGRNGVAYIDDFEGAQTKIELKSFPPWTLSSAPQTDANSSNTFGSSNALGIESGYNRAKLSWYTIDPVFYGTSSNKPSIDDADLYSHKQREVLMKELFPNKDDDISGFTSRISTLNLNYYPRQRGPYNYNKDWDSEDPENIWGGIMREIITTDFETSNIEYIEFWLMDPYTEDPNHDGGDLYIHLGEISEDILRDGDKSYENGFPTSETAKEEAELEGRVEATEWGYVPKGRALVNAFDNDPESRTFQDIGLDGLNDEDEKIFHGELGNPDDPSGDNFEYYLGSTHDSEGHNILERYKNYNGLERNSPVASDNVEYTAANKTTPDVEDINEDNTLNTQETYYQYKVSLRREKFEVGENYIVDQVEGAANNDGVKTNWYQFRIPISDFVDKKGIISDFKSIRFLRLMLNNFSQPVTLRFATLELVRGEWRRYSSDLQKAVPSINEQNDGTSFEVSAVNIEENGKKQPVNYVLPPGVTRATDPSQSQVKQLNEQSLLVKFEDLQENDARAVYKNQQLDLRQYQHLQMWIHAEALPGEESELKDNDLTAFIRIGSDYQNNYYEYEIPLTVTPHYSTAADTIWPTSNKLMLDVQKLVNLKVARNNAMDNDPLVSVTSVFVQNDGVNKMKVKGNPNLSNVRQIMLGVRNPGDEFAIGDNDGEPKSAEIWFNELRLTDFNNKGGWAANGRVQAKLADLGVINVAGATSKPGFGSIEQKTEERQREEINQVDVSSNLELGKFFPEKAKVSVPFYVGYSNTTINPEYYPKDPDRKLKDVLAEAKTKAERDSIKKISQDKTTRTSLNVTNVRWNKQFKKFKVVQPSNFSATVLYSNAKASNYSLDYKKNRKYGASLNYVYNKRPKNITPLKKLKVLRKPSLRIVRDFNFNYLPSSFTFSTRFDRNYQSMKIRNVYDDVDMVIKPTTSKSLYWDRNYSLRWDFTRALKFNYSATNNAIIDEPRVDDTKDYWEADLFEGNNDHWKDSVKAGIMSGGRTLQFNQKFGLSYTLPLNKIPFLNWTNIKASYDGNYSWLHGPIINDTSQLGHTIKNGNTIKLQGNLNMKNLYNKVGYFKQLDKKYSSRGGVKEEDKRYKTVEFNKRTFFYKEKPKNISHKLGTEDVTIVVTDNEGNVIDVVTEIINPNKVTIEVDRDISGVNVYVEGKIEKGMNPLVFIGENSVRFLLGFKNISVTLSQNASTVLDGYLPETNFMGVNTGDYSGAPGLPFVLGDQDPSINKTFSEQGLLTKHRTFSMPTKMGENLIFRYRTTFEPFKGFRIDFSGERTHSQTTTQNYYNTDADGVYIEDSKTHFIDNAYRGGNYRRSVITIGTAFDNITNSNGWESKAFNQLKANRSTISQRLSAKRTATAGNDENLLYTPSLKRPVEQGYGDGYSSSSSEVLMYSFLSAYTGADAGSMPLEQFSWLAMPNWKITFDGLSKIDFIQKFLKTLTLTHSYKSTYNIGQYSTNVEFFQSSDFSENEPDEIRELLNRDNAFNFDPEFYISTVSIDEQISPLIGFDMTWHNSMLTKFEWRKSRQLALSLNNQQVTESRNQDFVVGIGYRFKDVPLNISTTSGSKSIKSDLNMRFDISWRDNVTILRSINESTSDQATTGARKFVLGYTADYVLSQKVNVQFYIDWNRRTPFVSTSYPNSDFSFGFSLRLSL